MWDLTIEHCIGFLVYLYGFDLIWTYLQINKETQPVYVDRCVIEIKPEAFNLKVKGEYKRPSSLIRY